jgi:hypothetical protein
MLQVHNILMNSGLQGKIASVAITYSGQYASPPTGITFSGGGGSGAAATISTSGSVQTGSVISITTPSNYYSLGSPAPTVSFSGGGGSGAAASTTVTGVVTAVTVTDRGNYADAGNSPPTITASGGGGSGATFSVGMVWRTVTITGLVANYNYSDKIFYQESVGGPSPLIPIASVTCAYGVVTNAHLDVQYIQSSEFAYYLNETTPVYNNRCIVTGVSIGASGGQYYTSDTGQWGGFSIAITCGSNYTTGPGVTSCDVITWKVGRYVYDAMSAPVTVLNQGSGYTSVPTLTFSGGIAYSQATATATVQNKLMSVNIISGGSGYSSSPTVTLSTTGLQSGSGNPVAYTSAGTVYYVTGITMTNQGSSYTSAPAVSFTGGSAYSAAIATANLI